MVYSNLTDTIKNRFVNLEDLIPNATVDDLDDLRNHISGSFNPWVYSIGWPLGAATPDNSTLVGVGIGDLLYAFSFSGRIYKSSYMDGSTWTEIPYAKTSDINWTNDNVTNLTNNFNNLNNNLNSIEKDNNIRQKAYTAVPDWNFTDALDINNPAGLYGITPNIINIPIQNAYGFLFFLKNSDSSWILAIFINQDVMYTNFYNRFTTAAWSGWKQRF